MSVRAVDGADDAPERRRLARHARPIHHADVAVAERLDRRDHLLAVIAVRHADRHVHARVTGHEADRLVRRDRAAGELGRLRDLRVLAFVEVDRDRLYRPAPAGIPLPPPTVAFGVSVTCVPSSFATMLSDGLPADCRRRR